MATYNGDNTNNIYIGTNTDDTIYGNGGDDSLTGGDGNDILNGGLGNDYLQGDDGADTYLIAKADGQDNIDNYHSDNSMDVVTFTDMASTDITSVTRAQDGSDNLILTYGTDGQLTVDGYFSDAAYQINTFQFTDSTWVLADIIARASTITGTADDDGLLGFYEWSNTLYGLGGNDYLFGGSLADVIIGGVGNDYMQGNDGADTYLIAKADGQDDINNYHYDNSMDVVTFTDMASTDIISVTRSQDGIDNLILTYGTGGQLTVDNYFSDVTYQINTFQFTDSTWGLADIIARASAINGTADDDMLFGFNDWSNTLYGLGGNDYLVGGIGDDVLIGGDGNDWLQDMEGNNTLIGGRGNDSFHGGNGIDTYLIAKADGQDEIDYTMNDMDVVIFTDMTRSDITSITHSQDGYNSLVLTYGTDGQLAVNGYFDYTSYRINTFQFTDGTWTLADILIRTSVITGTASDDTLFGFDAWSSTISGLGGNDTLYGGGLADTLIGGDGNDILNGGFSNDYLEGDNGADTYLIAKADGQDEINNYDTDGSVDVVTFTDVALSGLAGINTNGTNLYLNYGTASQLVVDNYFYGDAYQVNQFQFAGGDMLANFIIGTDSSNDTLIGTNANDAISGLGGADTMAGGLGNDLYFVGNAGDVVTEASSAGTDTLLSSISYTLAANAENLILTGNNTINGTGNDLANMLTGNAAANVLAGGAGADTLTGGLGNDTFVFGTVTGGADKTLDVVSGIDKLQLLDGVAGLSIGNGDHSINNAALINGHGGFSTASELVVITPNIIGTITAANAATDIGNATSNYAVGNTRLFAVDNGVDSALYLFKSAGADAVVSAVELTLLGTLQGTAQTALADYVFT